MKVQVLLSCMNQSDHSIVERANLQTDAIVVNQSDKFQKETFQHNGSEIVFLTMDEKGVGLSRNNALMRSTAEIVLFADEDMTYVDGYEKMVVEEFRRNPKADFLVFNVPSLNPARSSPMISYRSRVRRHNCLKFGTVRMAIRSDVLKRKNISFSLLFGGGAKYSAGEDSLLIYSAIRSGIKVYAVPRTIGYVAQEGSSWFEGYNKKYFVDRGVLYRSLAPWLHPVFSIRFILRGRKRFSQDFSFFQLMRYMVFESKSA